MYLRILLASEGRAERETDKQIGAASAVTRTLYRSVLVKKEFSRNVTLSIYWSIYIPTLNFGHKLWVVTKRPRSLIQVAEISFL